MDNMAKNNWMACLNDSEITIRDIFARFTPAGFPCEVLFFKSGIAIGLSLTCNIYVQVYTTNLTKGCISEELSQ